MKIYLFESIMTIQGQSLLEGSEKTKMDQINPENGSLKIRNNYLGSFNFQKGSTHTYMTLTEPLSNIFSMSFLECCTALTLNLKSHHVANF